MSISNNPSIINLESSDILESHFTAVAGDNIPSTKFYCPILNMDGETPPPEEYRDAEPGAGPFTFCCCWPFC